MTAVSMSKPVSERLHSTFDPDRLHALGDEELDALPFGVIALDDAGRIARYNMAEARFARLDRAQVVGRSFFGEVARCTDKPEFHGRFDALLAGAKPATVRFEYVFAFRFGAQKVDVDMGMVSDGAASPSSSKAASSSSSPRVYLCINRRRFLPRQKEVPPSLEAPLIGELEPDAEAAGVTRDARGRRRIEVDVTMLGALLGTIARREKLGASAMLRDWGAAWGRLMVADLETEALERLGSPLGDLPMIKAMEIVAGQFHRQRLGRLAFDYAEAARGAIAVRVERSVFAEVSAGSACGVLEGLFGEIFTHLASRAIVVRESSCARSSGGAGSHSRTECLLVAVSASRAAAVERGVQPDVLTASAFLGLLDDA